MNHFELRKSGGKVLTIPKVRIGMLLLSAMLLTNLAGGESGGDRDCSMLAFGLISSNNVEADRALIGLEEAGRDGIPCLISLFRERGDFSGACGVQSEDLIEPRDGLSASEVALTIWTRRPEIREVALYTLLMALGEPRWFAKNCLIEQVNASAVTDSKEIEVALGEIAILGAEKACHDDPLEKEEVWAILRQHGLRFHVLESDE